MFPVELTFPEASTTTVDVILNDILCASNESETVDCERTRSRTTARNGWHIGYGNDSSDELSSV